MGRAFGIIAVTTAFSLMAPQEIQAGVECSADTDNNGVPDTIAGSATGSTDNTACGPGANANSMDAASANTAFGNDAQARSGIGGPGFNTAVGDFAIATGSASSNTAIGASANASGDALGGFSQQSSNTAIGEGAMAYGTDSDGIGGGSSNVGIGEDANAQGDDSGNVASGNSAVASGNTSNNVASGANSNASGNNSANVAIGDGADARGDNFRNTAVGANSSATQENTAAFGAGATTTRPNQQIFGTGTNTYTMAGIASPASQAAQGAPTHLVTSNAGGDLAAYTLAELGLASAGDVSNLQSQINNLGKRDDELAEGIAISLALAQPMFHAGQTFAFNFGWGGFDGSNAVGFTAAGVVSQGAFGPGSTVTVYGGVGTGTSEGTVAGKAGASFGF